MIKLLGFDWDGCEHEDELAWFEKDADADGGDDSVWLQ